jgi:histone-lysine N-methyltransferase SETD3
MVPMADMLNHKRPPETYWTFDDDLNAFTITATKDFKAGEQVYDSYGRKCNTEFFMNYGFVADNNQYNECQMVLRMPDNDPLYQQKKHLLGRDNRKLQFPRDYENETTMEAISFLRLAVATEAELHKLTGGSAYYRPNTKKIRPFNLRNECEMIKALAAAARDCLASFDTTLEDDLKIMESGNASRNVLNCVAVRICEKEVATHFLDFERVLLPLLDGQSTNRVAQDAIRDCKEIQGDKHFRHYVNTCILPLLEINRDDENIDSMIARFQQMQIATPAALDYEEDDDDSLDPLDATSLE